MISGAKPLAELQKGWSEIATSVNMMNPSEVPVVEGEFATSVNDWIAETKTVLGQLATTSTELDTAAGSAVEEELALAGAPTLADIMEKQRDIAKMAENGQDYREDTKELQEMIRKRNEALKNLTTASEGVNSQTESVFIPDVPDPTAPEGGDVPTGPDCTGEGEDDGEIEKGDKEKEGKDGNEGENPEGKPVDPGSDRKLPDVTPKPTSTSPSAETPSATPPSTEPSTRLSSDSPTPSATPTPSSTQTPTSSAMPTSTAAQPQMPQVQMPQSSPTSSATPQAQAAQTPTQQQTLRSLQDKIDAAKEKSEKDKDSDAAVVGDTSREDVGGAALLTGSTTAPPGGAPTTLAGAPTAPGAPTVPGTPGTPGAPPPGGVGGVGGSPAMGSGNAAQSKNANIIASAQPEPPLPTAPSVPGSKQSPNFNWNDDAVLPSTPPDQDKR